MQRSFVFGVLAAAGLVFAAPADVESLTVVERLAGNSTTDFGAPAVAPAGDAGYLVGQGPRGGGRWGARHHVCPAAWHVLDPAWEIENRL